MAVHPYQQALLGLICLGAITGSLAQVPDAGSLRQQYEREREVQLPRRIGPLAPAEPAPLTPAAGQSVAVTAFRFAGNTLLSTQRLSAVVAPYLNRPLDFAQLQAVTAAVASAYRQAGWVVRASLPKQDVTQGVVTIQIVEAVFGQASREGAEPIRLSPELVVSMVRAAQASGQPLNAEAVDRALLLADDLPGLSVTGTLVRGEREGVTDLILKMSDKPLLTADAALDNTGSRSTGRDRLSANLVLNSPFGAADQISGNFIHTQGSDYLRMGLTVPVGLDGWRAGVSASSMAYRLVAPEFSALSSRGTSGSTGFEASYPLFRTREKNLYFGLNYDSKHFDNQSNGTTTSHYGADTWSLSLNANTFDNWGGGGANRVSLSQVNGQINLDGSPSQSADATTTHTAGSFTKWRYGLSRQQSIDDDFSLSAQWSGQVANKNLDSSEKFYLGGAYGVRAYPTNEGGGSEGQMLNLELRWRLPEGLLLTGFYDWGRVCINRYNEFAGAPALNRYSLSGKGLSLSWSSPLGPVVKATWARRHGSNPNPSSTGTDQDGSLLKDRFWLSASTAF